MSGSLPGLALLPPPPPSRFLLFVSVSSFCFCCYCFSPLRFQFSVKLNFNSQKISFFPNFSPDCCCGCDHFGKFHMNSHQISCWMLEKWENRERLSLSWIIFFRQLKRRSENGWFENNFLYNSCLWWFWSWGCFHFFPFHSSFWDPSGLQEWQFGNFQGILLRTFWGLLATDFVKASPMEVKYSRLCLVSGKFDGKKIERKNRRKVIIFLLFGCSWQSWGKENKMLRNTLSPNIPCSFWRKLRRKIF